MPGGLQRGLGAYSMRAQQMKSQQGERNALGDTRQQPAPDDCVGISVSEGLVRWKG